MGSNIALGFEGEVPQLAGRIRRLPSPSIFFIIVRGGCVYTAVCVGGRRKRIREKGNVSGRGRSVPADRSIGRDFKADCSYKVKNFSRSPKSVYTYVLTRALAYTTRVWPVHAPGLYLLPLRGEPSKCLLPLSFALEHPRTAFRITARRYQIFRIIGIGSGKYRSIRLRHHTKY